jgi:hypothetical protein
MFTRQRILIAEEEEAEEIKKLKEDNDESDEKKIGKRDLNEELYVIEYPFFRLPTLHIPVLKDGKVTAYFHLKVGMEAFSPDTFNEARILQSRLIDGIFSDLYAALSNLWINNEDPKIEVIKERVLRVSNKILGKDKIKSVFARQVFLDH